MLVHILMLCFNHFKEAGNLEMYARCLNMLGVIYGALGTVIVLLMWLYLTAIILIFGAEVNAALMTVKNEMTGSY